MICRLLHYISGSLSHLTQKLHTEALQAIDGSNFFAKETSKMPERKNDN